MADISTYLAQIMAAVFGKDVRKSIHDAIDAVNQAQEKAISSGTAINAGDPASGDFYENALYINTATDQLLRCDGTTWIVVGSIKGNGIREITGPVTSGLTDTYTVHYTDGTDYSFSINNGNKWYIGTDVSGKVAIGAVFTLSYQVMTGDNYLNKSEDAIYHCTSGAPAGVPSTWVYDLTITSSSTGTNDYTALINQPYINLVQLIGNQSGHDLGLANLDDIDEWLNDGTNPIQKPMPENSTSVTFTATEMATVVANGWGVKAYFSTAKGTVAPTLKRVVHNLDDSLTITYSKVKASQAAGNQCYCQLRIVR